FTLTGPGHEQIVRDGNTWDVVLTGTDARSIFTIKSRGGDGHAEVDDIRVDGSLGKLRAGTTDLTGDLAVRGTLGELVVDDVHGGTVRAKSIDEITIQGDLDDDSVVQAGALPKYVEIDHERIDPAHDPRFITHTRGHHARLSLEAHLKHDTGASASDGVTSDPTIAGTLEHSQRIRSFKAGFDDT